MKLWHKPMNKMFVGITSDSMSFKNINISSQVEIPIFPHCGSFGAKRKYDTHKGVDLYANEGDEVFAVEDGIVTLIRPFTGSKLETPWWEDTDAVNICGETGNIVYGELTLSPTLFLGKEIKEGEYLGTIKKVLKIDKGRPMAMLHFALHKHGIQSNGEWKLEDSKPDGLLDPTIYLIHSFILNRNL